MRKIRSCLRRPEKLVMFNFSAIECNSETDFRLSSVMSTVGDSMVPITSLKQLRRLDA